MSCAEVGAISATSSAREYVDGDLWQCQQHGIINACHECRHMSAHELLKEINVTSGMPVMFVLSSDGRLAAVPVDVLQNPAATKAVPMDAHQNPAANNKSDDKKTPDDKKKKAEEKKHENLRSWLLLLTSLAATISFTARLTPPGGFWGENDDLKGYVAGTSVMRGKFHVRYMVFFYSNATAFFSSLVVIGMLAKGTYNELVMKGPVFIALAAACFVSLGTSYISGTWDSSKGGIYTVVLFVAVLVYMSTHWIRYAINKIVEPKKPQGLPSVKKHEEPLA